MAEQFLLLAVTPKRGKLNDTIVWTVIWMKTSDLSIWTQTLDPSYGNWRKNNWDRFVTEPVYGLYTNLKETNRTDRDGNGVVSADRRPTLLEPTTQNQAIEVAEALANQLT
jgi:hypothetical protein